MLTFSAYSVVISDVTNSSITENEVTINWTTDLESNSTVLYGINISMDEIK